MPPKAVAGLTENERMLLAIIKCTSGITGIKWDEVAAVNLGTRTGNAIRQKYQKMRADFEKGGAAGGDSGAGEYNEGEVKPIATKKNQAPITTKKRKIEQVEEGKVEDVEDVSE